MYEYMKSKKYKKTYQNVKKIQKKRVRTQFSESVNLALYIVLAVNSKSKEQFKAKQRLHVTND